MSRETHKITFSIEVSFPIDIFPFFIYIIKRKMEEKERRKIKGKESISTIILVLSDIFSISLSLLISYSVRASILPLFYSGFKVKPVPLSNFLSSFYIIFVWIILFFHDRLYTRRPTFWEETRLVVKNSTLSISILLITTYILRKERAFSRAIFILWWLSTLFVIPLFRRATKFLLMKLKLWERKVLIVGAGSTGLGLAEEIISTPYLGYTITGFLDDDKEKIGKRIAGIEVLGKISEIEKWIKKTDSKDVIIAIPSISQEKLRSVLEKCEPVAKNISFVSKFGIFSLYNLRIEHVESFLLISMKGGLLSSWKMNVKDLYERLIVIILLPFLIFITVLISVLIKIDSSGPVFFSQERVGKNGKRFKFIKFRTMFENSEEILQQTLSSNPELKEEWERFRKIRGSDPRVTRIGKFLRKWSLDEIPQFFHVLKGEMSLVGPRPYMPKEIEKNSSFRIIKRVKPGITGLWQIEGRNLLTFEERLKIDEFYIRNWSLWQDIIILIKTVGAVLKGEGAF